MPEQDHRGGSCGYLRRALSPPGSSTQSQVAGRGCRITSES